MEADALDAAALAQQEGGHRQADWVAKDDAVLGREGKVVHKGIAWERVAANLDCAVILQEQAMCDKHEQVGCIQNSARSA